MGTFGRRAAAARASDSGARRMFGVRGRWSGFLGLLAGLLLLAACSASFQFGRQPPVASLATLQPGVSTTADVRRVLGDPDGHGNIWMEGNPMQDLWVYRAADIQGTRSRMNVLLVFIDQKTGVYTGYMWFRAGQIFSTSS